MEMGNDHFDVTAEQHASTSIGTRQSLGSFGRFSSQDSQVPCQVNDVGSLDLLVVTPAGKQLAQGGPA